jgi:uncharacterized membrane protein
MLIKLQTSLMLVFTFALFIEISSPIAVTISLKPECLSLQVTFSGGAVLVCSH